MRYYVLLLLLLNILSCKTEKQEPKLNRFEVNKHQVGSVNDSTQIKELTTIFFKDSIVNYKEDDSFIGGINAYTIFESNGNQLLRIFPNEALDSTTTINYIELKDSRFKTKKGISISSSFQEVKNAYRISEIRNKINSVEFIINEIDATLVIQKKELLTTFDFGEKIDVTQIPDSSKFTSFIINF